MRIEIRRMQNELQYLQDWKRNVSNRINQSRQRRVKTTSVAAQTECEECVETASVQAQTVGEECVEQNLLQDAFECGDDFECV